MGSTLSDGTGNYTLAAPTGGSYTVTPSKAPLPQASPGIDTVDVIAVQGHYLEIAPLTGCQLAAADVNGDTLVNTQDVIATQRFYLGFGTGIGNAGKYQFTPAFRTYTAIVTNQPNEDYAALIFGDVATGFVHRPDGSSPSEADGGTGVDEVPSTVAAIALPSAAVDPSVTGFIVPVTTTTINARDRLIGFQGDFTFDQRVATFQSEPVQKAGLTGGDWNVTANVLDGKGPIRTLRISAYSNDFTPLAGSGTLFELRMTRVSKAALSTQLIWAAPPDHFIFIDADLKTQKPGYAGSGSLTPSKK